MACTMLRSATARYRSVRSSKADAWAPSSAEVGFASAVMGAVEMGAASVGSLRPALTNIHTPTAMPSATTTPGTRRAQRMTCACLGGSRVGGVQIPLTQAVKRLNAEPGGFKSSYETYRSWAARQGKVSMGGHLTPIFKQGRRWMVEESDLELAVAKHRETYGKQAEMAEDYKARILHQGSVVMDGGGYRVSGLFHLVWSDIAIARMKSNGSWRCNSCWGPATTEHKGEECHKCRDWGSCGGQCTLNALTCRTCSQPTDAEAER